MTTLLYSIVPITGFAVVVILTFWMWRRHKLAYNYHDQLPNEDPSPLPSPSPLVGLKPLQLKEVLNLSMFSHISLFNGMSEKKSHSNLFSLQ